jgi:hypothetical protein
MNSFFSYLKSETRDLASDSNWKELAFENILEKSSGFLERKLSITEKESIDRLKIASLKMLSRPSIEVGSQFFQVIACREERLVMHAIEMLALTLYPLQNNPALTYIFGVNKHLFSNHSPDSPILSQWEWLISFVANLEMPYIDYDAISVALHRPRFDRAEWMVSYFLNPKRGAKNIWFFHEEEQQWLANEYDARFAIREYMTCGKERRARLLVRNILERKPTAIGYCLLGRIAIGNGSRAFVTSCFEKALEMNDRTLSPGYIAMIQTLLAIQR